MLLKAAILLEWINIFVPRGTQATRSRNTFVWASHAILWINVTFYSIVTIIDIVQCMPKDRLWNDTLPNGKCDLAKLTLSSSPVNLFSDLVILILPQKAIWNLHISFRKRVGISMAFTIGVL